MICVLWEVILLSHLVNIAFRHPLARKKEMGLTGKDEGGVRRGSPKKKK